MFHVRDGWFFEAQASVDAAPGGMRIVRRESAHEEARVMENVVFSGDEWATVQKLVPFPMVAEESELPPCHESESNDFKATYP